MLVKVGEGYLQPVARQLGTIALHTVYEGQQQILLHCHEGIAIRSLHIAGDVDGDLIPRDLVQEHTPVQLLDDAGVLTYDLAHVSNNCSCPHYVVYPQTWWQKGAQHQYNSGGVATASMQATLGYFSYTAGVTLGTTGDVPSVTPAVATGYGSVLRS